MLDILPLKMNSHATNLLKCFKLTICIVDCHAVDTEQYFSTLL